MIILKKFNTYILKVLWIFGKSLQRILHPSLNTISTFENRFKNISIYKKTIQYFLVPTHHAENIFKN